MTSAIADDYFVVDNQGDVLDSRSAYLQSMTTEQRTIKDVATQLARLCGWISVCIGKRSVHVAFNPESVSQIAVGGLLYLLHDLHLHRRRDFAFCVSTLAATPRAPSVIELYDTISKAVNRLQFLTAEAHGLHIERLKESEVHLTDALRDRGYARLLEEWSINKDNFDFGRVQRILKKDLWSQFMLFEPIPGKQSIKLLAADSSSLQR